MLIITHDLFFQEYAGTHQITGFLQHQKPKIHQLCLQITSCFFCRSKVKEKASYISGRIQRVCLKLQNVPLLYESSEVSLRTDWDRLPQFALLLQWGECCADTFKIRGFSLQPKILSFLIRKCFGTCFVFACNLSLLLSSTVTTRV